LKEKQKQSGGKTKIPGKKNGRGEPGAEEGGQKRREHGASAVIPIRRLREKGLLKGEMLNGQPEIPRGAQRMGA